MKKVLLVVLLPYFMNGNVRNGSFTISPQTPSSVLKGMMDASVHPAGLTDKRFGLGGFVKQPFLTDTFFGVAKGLVILSDKKIVLAGYTGNPIADAGTGRWKIALVRYLPTGVLDMSFGCQGKVVHQFSDLLYDQINAIVAQSDGAFLVGGEMRSGGVGRYKFLLARYTNAGILDTSYGQGGKVDQPFLGTGLYDEINGLCLQSNNYTSAIGYSKDAGGQKIAVARYNSSGILDTTFGNGGSVLQPFLGSGQLDAGVVGIACSDGTLLVAGTSSDGGAGQIKCVVLRYTAMGGLVSTFGKAGVILQPFVGTGNHDEITCMVLQPNGSLIVGEFSSDQGGQKGLLIRYTSNGVLDSTFGVRGVMKQPFLGGGATMDRINALVLQLDGKIVVAGATNDGGGDTYFLARYQVNGTLDPTFGVGGVARYPFVGNGAGDEVRSMALAYDGAFVASGYTQDDDGSKMFVTRIINPIDFSNSRGQLGGFYG